MAAARILFSAPRRHRQLSSSSLPLPSSSLARPLTRQCRAFHRRNEGGVLAGVAALSMLQRVPFANITWEAPGPSTPFGARRYKQTSSKKSKKKGSQDPYKQQLKPSHSIIGKRPGQTSFAPPADKTVTSAPKAQTPIPSIPKTKKPPGHAQAKTNANTTMPLVLPPSISATDGQSSSSRDNKDHAHFNPSASSITISEEASGEGGSPMRSLFLQQGILPPPARPEIDKVARKAGLDADSPPPEIPEADPSGVSHANPEDVLDMASMYEPSIHLPDKPNFNSPANRLKYEAGTPLTDELIAYIGVRGPITVAEFMRRVLRDGEHGYYTGKGSRSGKAGGALNEKEEDDVDDDNDWDLEDHGDLPTASESAQPSVGGEHVIGAGGDFITAPEVSQLFGESLLVWLMTQYQALNSPSKIQIVEIGPGKGTLICDIVRSAITTFPDFAAALTSSVVDSEEGQENGEKKVAVGVHLVEVTNGMRARQRESIQTLETESAIAEKGYSFRFVDETKRDAQADDSDESTICVSWHDVLSSVPTHDATTGEPIPTFVICQELVDALAIHSFQKIEGGVWRERLVDVAIRDDSEASSAAEDVRMAVARRYASAEVEGATTESSPATPSGSDNDKKIPRLRFVLPPDTTPALRTILRVDNRGSPGEGNPMAASLNALPVGSVIEACPEGLLLVQDIADRIEKCKGAALIIDYGGDGSSGGDSLRGFWKHTQVHPLSRPGEVDVTADVDFGALREAVNRRVGLEGSLARQRKKDGMVTEPSQAPGSAADKSGACQPEAFGPISQGKFLAQMGTLQRVETKIMDDATTDEQADEIYSAMERLMAADQMGERYKVLAIAPKKDDLFPPPAF